jgi:hypothetical protein
MHVVMPQNRRCELANESGLEIVAAGYRPGRDVGDQRHLGIADCNISQVVAKRTSCAGKQRRMEGAADIQGYDALGAGRLERFTGGGHGSDLAADGHLTFGVVICQHDDTAFGRGLPTYIGDLVARQAHDRSHGAGDFPAGSEHQFSALADDAQTVGRRQGAGNHGCRELTQGMAGHQRGRDAEIPQGQADRNRMGQDGGLGVTGFGQDLAGTFEHDLRQILAQDRVDLIQEFRGRSTAVSQIPGHAHALGSLAGKDHGQPVKNFGHDVPRAGEAG